MEGNLCFANCIRKMYALIQLSDIPQTVTIFQDCLQSICEAAEGEYDELVMNMTTDEVELMQQYAQPVQEMTTLILPTMEMVMDGVCCGWAEVVRFDSQTSETWVRNVCHLRQRTEIWKTWPPCSRTTCCETL